MLRRDGAYAWGVAEYTGDAGRVIEWFMVKPWAEHNRVSHADADLQNEDMRLHIGSGKLAVHHFLSL